MTERLLAARGAAGVAVLLLIAVLFLAGPLALHFAQKSHNELPFVVEEVYPSGTKFPPGEAFAATLKALIEHELDSPTGWRPNDFFLWGPSVMADNNANRQVGIILALRESTTIMKDHLTKVSSDEYDANLIDADTLFRNDYAKFWFPSSEGRFRKGIESLQAYIDGLSTQPPKSKPMNRRNVEAIRLFQKWSDLLGDAHANLFKTRESDGGSIPPWRNDDYFYHAQGMAHVMYHLVKAVRVEYQTELETRPTIKKLMDEVASALSQAAVLKPFVILDFGLSSPFANHRRNLLVFIDEARQKMYSIREELEK
jgi:hypothetical protein